MQPYAPGLQIITTSPLPSGTVGVAYTTPLSATGGQPPYTWVVAGAVGTNIWYTTGGVGILHGTLSTPETDYVNIKVTDSVGATTTNQMQVVVNAAGGSASITGGTALSNSLVHGSAYTVLGSNLGTRPNFNFGGYTWHGQTHMHYVWCDFSAGEPATYTQAGWNAVLGGMSAQMQNPSNATVIVPAQNTYSGTNSGRIAGGPSAGGYYWQQGPNPSGATSRYHGLYINFGGIPNSSYTGEYWTYKYWQTGSDGGVAPLEGEKTTRRSFDYTTTNKYECITHTAPGYLNTGSPTTYYLESGAGSWLPPTSTKTGSNIYAGYSTTVQGQGLPDFTAGWNRFEQIYDTLNVSIKINNQQTYLGNGGGLSPPYLATAAIVPPTATYTLFNPTWLPGGASGSTGGLMTFCSESAIVGATLTYNMNVADIYGDLTWSRMEVTDGTHTEPMILTLAANGEWDFVFNIGQITSGSNRTLNLINSSNVVVASTTVTVA